MKLRRNRKGEQDQKNQLEQTQAQGAAQAEAAEAQAKAEIDKQGAVMKTQMRLEEIKTTGKAQILTQEAAIKERLMEREFQYAMHLEKMKAREKSATDIRNENNKSERSRLQDTQREDRKDQRTKMQATHQSELIDQKNNNKPPKNFESSSNDMLGGGFDLGTFGPR